MSAEESASDISVLDNVAEDVGESVLDDVVNNSAVSASDEAYLLRDEEEEPIETSLDLDEDPEIEAIKARVKEMEEEANKLKEMQKAAEDTLVSPTHSNLMTSPSAASGDSKADTDMRSVYVGNVDYSATATDLEQHFHGCGSVNRVTILCDKFTGNPKGFAYVEFSDKDSVETACQLTDSLFKGRQIKVSAKRTNLPGISSTNRFPRSRGRGRGRGGNYYGGGYGGGGGFGGGGFSPRGRGRGAFRSRRAQWFSPY